MSRQYTDHLAPEGLLTRGTVIVVPGRGETRAVYERFGRRLAADAYRVRVVDTPDLSGDDLDASLDTLVERLAEAADGTASEAGGTAAAPLVLVGSDSGAAAVAALVADPARARRLRADAVVLAGLPGRAAATAEAWDEELDVRTSCPTHRGVLTDDALVRRGELNTPVPERVLELAHDSAADLPQLLLVGDADPLADRDALALTAQKSASARLAVVHGAHHDVLNDKQHRSVAAEVVGFLEALREGLTPAVTVVSSAW
ncbi:alpha/beta hydrolase [Streptomyces endophyticus]|uniref:Lysophospholipase n=1 Tax=Streptomyces endophyticus TaxID=714166 RepID=A0ABU6EW49_9ACTN|nr:alpha/beta hydrolase [Streptomyces endophyticus]MEB8335978.1 lysophospholipase [Streptomyces endophyticus]